MDEALNELSREAKTLNAEVRRNEFPLIFMACERRSYNANQIFRTPDWRKTDKDGAMRIHPDDLESLSLEDGGRALCRSTTGQIEVVLMSDDSVQLGMVTLPHGYGMLYTDKSGALKQNGPAINELTSVNHCDPIAKTPYHKHVAVAVEALA